MFVVQALYAFSQAILTQNNDTQQNNQVQKKEQLNVDLLYCIQSEKAVDSMKVKQNQPDLKDHQQQQEQENKQLQQGKRARSKSHQKDLQKHRAKQQQIEKQVANQIQYLAFSKGDKLLVIQSYQNGWWYGHTIENPDYQGFFPSNYVQVPLNKPKPPLPPSEPAPGSDSEEQLQIYDPRNQGVDWVQKQLKNVDKGPVESSYYLGIKGYKTVKIDEKNQNILKGNNVKFDVNTGLARVPIKDQAPAAKSVRQMGYYFDYHQWTEERNKNPDKKSRPDIRKKKPKQLKLKGMD